MAIEKLYHGTPGGSITKFDFKRIGTNQGLDKYGWGIYLTDNMDTAEYYANDTSIGKMDPTIHLVRVDTRDVAEYEHPISDRLVSKVVDYLEDAGKEDDAGELQEEVEQYGNWSHRELYEWLAVVLGSNKKASLALSKLGISGFKVEDGVRGGHIYVIFDESLPRILEVISESGPGRVMSFSAFTRPKK